MTLPNMTGPIDYAANSSLDYPYGAAVRVADITTVSLLIVLGITGNTLLITCYVMLKCSQVLGSGDMFIINMVISDLIITATMFPMLGNIIMERNILPPGLCQLFGFLIVLGCVVSIYSLCMLALCRLCFICYSQKAHLFSTKNSIMYCICVWLFSTAVSLPPYLGWGEFGYSNKFLHCSIDYSTSLSYTLFLYILVDGGALCITFICYNHIFKTIKRSTSNVASYDNQKGKQAQAKTRLRQVFGSFVISAMFAVMWTPFCVTTLIDYYLDVNPHVVKIVTWLGLTNSYFNSFTYIFINRHYRNAGLKLLQCVKLAISPERGTTFSTTQV